MHCLDVRFTNAKAKKGNKHSQMATTAQKVPDDLLRRARRIALPHGGKEELKRITGITGPTINSLLGSGKAHPATIEKLRAAFDPQNEQAA